MKKVQGVILDLDGTLVDSNQGRTAAWVEAFSESGYSVTHDQVRAMIGLVPHEILTRAVGFGEDAETGRKIRDRFRRIFLRRYLPRITPTYRARELLVRLETEGFRLAVASVDPPEVLLPILRLLGAEPLLHRAAYPAADGPLLTNRDILKGALDKLGLPPGRTLLIADAPHDVEAANKLGVSAIALTSGGFSPESLKSSVAIYADAYTLLAEIDRSPLATPLAA